MLHGAVLSVGDAGPEYQPVRPGAAAGTLRVIAGPDAGFGVALPTGRHIIGRDAEADVCLHDPDVSRTHAALEISADGKAAIWDVGSRNGTFVNGVRSTVSVPVDDGSVVRLGADELRWESAGSRELQVSRTADGRLEFHRVFAEEPVISPADVDLPAHESARRNIGAMVVSPVIGIATGLALFATTHSKVMLLVSFLGILSPFAIYAFEGPQHRRGKRALARARDAAADKVTALAAEEDRARHLLTPGPAETLQIATGARRALWPRDARSPHGLVLRVGVTDQDPAIRLRGVPWDGFEVPRLRGVPVTVDLRQTGVLGVVGAGEPARALLRWLIVQLATLCSPDDLELVLLMSDDGADIGWARWLPHLDPGPTLPVPCTIGNTDESRTARIEELKQRINDRQAERRDVFRPVVVVLDGALALRNLPGIHDILRSGPEVGVYALCADSQDMNECRGVCALTADGLRVVRSPNGSAVTAVPEGVDVVAAERVARALAPMRDRTSDSGRQTAMPDSVRLLDLLNIGVPTAEDVLTRWHERKAGSQTDVTIGADATGPVTVDLADMQQGPHAMLGGAPGAGKSKLLQTLITSLLLANRPDELNFVLVDFKGGSTFLPFENCPHVTGLILSTGKTAADTFDELDVARVLASVQAEVARREAALARFGGEIDEYWRARESQPTLPPLPRLVMIFDEYGRVLESSHEFRKELVKVASKGRSLGMHLVLATQSLQGKLGPELKNNITLRISLRQTEPADSTEVLSVADAATIPATLSGRGMILRMGARDKTPRPFQSGYLGDPPPGGTVSRLALRTLRWPDLGAARPVPVRSGDGEATDQDLAIAAVNEAARRARVRAPYRVLLPKLPASVSLGQLANLQTEAPPGHAVPFGLTDVPEHQAQPPTYLDLAANGGLMVAGGKQSGRTTFARALITSLATRFRPDEVHLYVVEHRPAGLSEYAALPHCGGVFSPAEPDRIRRLVGWLEVEKERRSADRLSISDQDNPAIVLVVDGWEQFETRAKLELMTVSLGPALREVMQVGAPLGMHIVPIGGQELVNGKVADLCNQRLLLTFPNESIRRPTLHGAKIPSPLPGRAIDAETGRHIQICTPGVSGAELVDSVVADYELAVGGPARLPRQFPSLPPRVGVEELALPSPLPTQAWIPLGLGGPDVSTIGLDLFDAGPHLMLISGPSGSGRTTAIASLARLLRRRGVGVLTIAPPRSPLTRMLADDDVHHIAAASVEDSDLREAAGSFGGRYAVLLDDADSLLVLAAKQGFGEAPTLLDDIARPSELGHRALIIAGDATPILSGSRRFLARPATEALDTGFRLLLTPKDRADARQLKMGSLEPDQYFTGIPGRGYLASDGAPTLIQLAICPGRER
jgi:S-DNA-T family DNA segregation ATPase FtsK/SpoIIIE